MILFLFLFAKMIFFRRLQAVNEEDESSTARSSTSMDGQNCVEQIVPLPGNRWNDNSY